jgi:hypothetical protein
MRKKKYTKISNHFMTYELDSGRLIFEKVLFENAVFLQNFPSDAVD